MKNLLALTVLAALTVGAPAWAKGWLETPFTAEQLQAALPDGTRMSIIFTDAEGTRIIRDWVFHDPSRKGVVVQSTARDDAGKVVEPTADTTHTWVELARHARFREDDATRARAVFDVRLGHYEGWVYDADEVGPDGGALHKRLWFADQVPGPPLRMEVSTGGVVVMTMELMSRVPMPLVRATAPASPVEAAVAPETPVMSAP